MKEEEIREKVKKALSPSRFAHVEGVVHTAARLAARYGADEQKARLAAWIHDWAREWPVSRLEETAAALGIDRSLFGPVAVLHGPIAAASLEREFGIADDEIADAVRYHTTGRPGMTLLERVVCLADAVEPGRAYPGVDRLRQLARQDLDLALAEMFDATLRDLLDRGRPLAVLTVLARNECWERIRARGAR
ncbi:MAG: bis(5'-nucleosyl)-tetraphosphatase (symmetrical) YqeK [Alicyclobacillaceae bacterium]|nr:bis(5'-nucleosyl)-tetraphosphatase (symmetrical) YqeK [Alicyclobacillaceae bacterium]